MTAALYIYGRQLFLYYEAIGEEMGPEAFMAPLSPLLSLWPEKENTVPWAKMYHIYWHCEPKDETDWRRDPKPLRRRGRIAYLKHDTLFEYVYHHFAIVREGLLKGDKYMSIALHEDVLFSYFEEPRSSVNIRRADGPESQAIQGWLDVNPEAHFIPLPGSNGQNFLLLPECFFAWRLPAVFRRWILTIRIILITIIESMITPMTRDTSLLFFTNSTMGDSWMVAAGAAVPSGAGVTGAWVPSPISGVVSIEGI